MRRAKEEKVKYTASMLVRVQVDIDLNATTLEDAVTEAKELKIEDCIEIDGGDYLDGSIEPINVSSNRWRKVDD